MAEVSYSAAGFSGYQRQCMPPSCPHSPLVDVPDRCLSCWPPRGALGTLVLLPSALLPLATDESTGGGEAGAWGRACAPACAYWLGGRCCSPSASSSLTMRSITVCSAVTTAGPRRDERARRPGICAPHGSTGRGQYKLTLPGPLAEGGKASRGGKQGQYEREAGPVGVGVSWSPPHKRSTARGRVRWCPWRRCLPCRAGICPPPPVAPTPRAQRRRGPPRGAPAAGSCNTGHPRSRRGAHILHYDLRSPAFTPCSPLVADTMPLTPDAWNPSMHEPDLQAQLPDITRDADS